MLWYYWLTALTSSTEMANNMTPIKEAAIKMIQELPDDQVVYVLNIIKGVQGLFSNTEPLADGRLRAFNHIQQFRGRIPLSLDYDTELAKSRAERYARTD